ncbi:MAG: hypothetical protein M3O30_07070 [Planctomycetota bacterium]|nr:hypothetical protein [Planctomycetota bacterium]
MKTKSKIFVFPRVILAGIISCGSLSCAVAQQPSGYFPDPQQNIPPQQYNPAPPVDPAAQSSRWPMQATASDGAQVTIFQPQLEDFQGDQIKARAAVAVIPANQTQQVFGAIWLQSRVETDRVNRTVRIVDVNVIKTQFPGEDPVAAPVLADAVRQVILAHPATLSLDQLLTMLETIQKQNVQAAALQSDPPKIVFMDHPAMKVQFDGTPRLAQVKDTNLYQAVNTPFFVVLDPDTKRYYLKGAGRWFEAPDPIGPYQISGQVPGGVSKLAESTGYQDPQQPISDDQARGLEIVTATEPTEVVWTEGEPQLSTIAGTSLLYVTNTDADVFMSIDNQQVYVLLSGRWYSASSRHGPWINVPADRLPDDFKHIPPNSEKGDVLAHIPGTSAAQDAIADTAIPQTAAIDRHQYDQPPVEYDGDPNFQPIEGTQLTYAVNTAGSVIGDNGQYYCCYHAAWYQCDSPRGNWQICTRVPEEVYAIPPSCPLYPVTYCHVYGYTPDVCYVGYTPGYTGCYVHDGVVIYGTGYRYHPWEGERFYVPRPLTFGYGAHYNTYSGHWGFSFAMRFGGATWVRPEEKFDGRGGQWFGYGGYRPTYGHSDAQVRDRFVRDEIAARPVAQNRAPRDTYARDVYQRRNDLHREIIQDNQRPADRRNQSDAGGNQNDAARNDIYSDPQGNVYRRTMDGWQQRDNAHNQWQPAPPAEAPHNVAQRNDAQRGVDARGGQPGPGNRDAANRTDQRPNDPQPGGEGPRNNAPRDNAVRGDASQSPAAPAQPPQDQPRVILPRGGTEGPRVQPTPPSPSQENPKTQAPRERPAKADAPHQEPAKAEAPKQEAPHQDVPREKPVPAPGSSNSDLNKDYQARVAGEQRSKAYHEPAPPPPAAPAPRPPAPAAKPAPQAPANPPPPSGPNSPRGGTR